MRERIRVTGVVQGVGFRPFVYRLATEMALGGYVRNDGRGVVIEVEGQCRELTRFRERLREEAPPLSAIDALETKTRRETGGRDFQIRASSSQATANAAIPADTALCPDCRRELTDPADRRYNYPFLNCINCGPRYSITTSVPYDRPGTTMADFSQCSACATEYADPANRRFHAQPNACPACGPQLELRAGGHTWTRAEALEQTRRLLVEGAIVAIKGIGGFQLACDASNEEAVQILRERKRRPSKPLAVMLRSVDEVRAIAICSPAERRLLESPESPIVLLQARPNACIAPSVAPGMREIGCMLPYSPLHHLLFENANFQALVMTSGNRSEEPIARGNEEALVRLSTIADAFLLHNRDIAIRLDDSVAAIASGEPLLIRRARGYTPRPLQLAGLGPCVLAVGAQWKNTVCYLSGRQAILSQHIGDLDTLESMQMFDETRLHLESFFHIKPEVIAHDLHPSYRSTQWALDQTGARRIAVQHHHAHIAACAAEHRIPGPVLGVAMDGTGLGTDGAIWGGEFLICEGAGFARLGHLLEVPLPGGDAAVREPWRMALSWLREAGLEPPEHLSCEDAMPVWRLCANPRQPRTTSAGRFFDAVAALIGLCRTTTFEGEAAMLLDAAASARGRPYPFDLEESGATIIDFRETVRAIARDHASSVPPSTIAARTHATLARAVSETAARIASRTGIRTVLLSGGCFQNRRLLRDCVEGLSRRGLTVHWPKHVPANDGGISLGQAVIARGLLGG